ncbi:hypothetical protein ABEF95_005660 [Exophiala dermatitidis]
MISHIFCTDCSRKAGLTDVPRAQRRCPVCGTNLPNIDDAVQTRLNPSEEYKASVLSGLDPTTIMECAGRAIAFWTYQITQEISYQEYVARNLSESNDHLSTSVDKIIHDANAEIQALEKKLAGTSGLSASAHHLATHSDSSEAVTLDHRTMEQKYVELVDMYREKSRKHSQTQKLYDTLKKKCLAEQTHGAAHVVNNPAAADASAPPTIRAVNTMPQPELSRLLRTESNQEPAQRPKLAERRDLRGQPSFRHGPEQLHPHQRSGSSVHGAGGGGEQGAMPAPEKARSSNIGTSFRALSFLFLISGLRNVESELRQSHKPRHPSPSHSLA